MSSRRTSSRGLPLARGTVPAETTEPSQANTSEWGNSQPYFDALLGRYYNDRERWGKPPNNNKYARKPDNCYGTTEYMDATHKNS